MSDADLAFTPAVELARLIKAREVSPVDLVELYFQRIDEIDSKLNAFLTLDHDGALLAAKAAEQAVVDGHDLPPFHGVPLAVKDVNLTKGLRSTGGSLAYADRIPDADGAVVERFKDAGTVIIGKTNTPEFGLLGANENRLGDDYRNPWNTERTSGASSGGAAAALAAGMSPMAPGGDGGGSIRIPASYCGLYGIKPTQGRVSAFGGAPGPAMANYTSQNGPLSRTVLDSAALLQVISGYDPRDPGGLREPVPDFTAAVERGVDGLRIGWSPDYGYTPVDSEVVEVTSAAAKAFEDLGCAVEQVDLSLESPFDPWWIFFATGAHAREGHLLEHPDDPLTWYGREAIEYGATVTGVDYARPVGARARMVSQFDEVFDKYDLLLSPTMATAAFPVRQYPQDNCRPRNLSQPSLGIYTLHSPDQYDRESCRQRALRLL